MSWTSRSFSPAISAQMADTGKKPGEDERVVAKIKTDASIGLQQRRAQVHVTARKYWQRRVQCLDLTGKARCQRFEWERSVTQVRQSDVNPSFSAVTPVADKEFRWYKIVSPQYDNVDYLEKIHSNVRRKLGSSTTRWHASHRRQHDDLGNVYVRDNEGGGASRATYQEYPRSTKNTDFDKIKYVFGISRRLIMHQDQDFFGISTIDWNTIPCQQRCTSSQIQCCLGGRLAEYPRWSPGKTTLIGSHNLQSRARVENFSQGTPQWSNFKKSEDDRGKNIRPEEFTDRIIFMLMYTTSIGDKEERKTFLMRAPRMLLHTPQIFPKDVGHSSDLGLTWKGTERSLTNQTAEKLMIIFRESGKIKRNVDTV